MVKNNAPSDLKIEEYIDNQLNERDRAMVAAQMLANPQLARKVELLRRQNEALTGVGQEILDERVPDRLRFVVQPEAKTFGRRRFPLRGTPFLEAFAAIVLFVLGGGIGWFASGTINKPGEYDLDTANMAGIYTFYGAERDYPIDFPLERTPELVGWLDRAFERTINPPDLSSHAYQYRGGRLLPAAGRSVGLFQFDGPSDNRVFVFLWRSAEIPQRVAKIEHLENVQVRYWMGDGLSLAVVSEATNPDIDAVADAVFSSFDP